MSHCVNYTTRDIMDHWDKAMGALVVLTDGKLFISIYVSVSMFWRQDCSLPHSGASPVQGFKVDADEFLRHCVSKGVSLHTISEAFEGCKAKAAIWLAARNKWEGGNWECYSNSIYGIYGIYLYGSSSS